MRTKHTKLLITLSLGIMLTLALSVSAFAQTAIYRSVAPGKTTAVDDDNSHGETLTISGSTATFNTAGVALDVGVGDAIVYDTGGTANVLDASDSIVFIHARGTSQSFTVKDDDGTDPSTTTETNDTWAIYRAYTGLFYAEGGTRNTSIPMSFAGGNRDIDANNEVWNIACYANGSTADTTSCNFNGWTTASDNYIRVFTPTSTSEVGTSQRHSGKWDDTKYKMEFTSANYDSYLSITEEYVRIEGLQVQISVSAFSGVAVRIMVNNASSAVYITDNIIRAGSLHPYTTLIRGLGYNSSASNNVYVWNNIFYDFTTGSTGEAIRAYSDTGYSKNYYIYNNTMVNCYSGIYSGSVRDVFYAQNNIVKGSAADMAYYGTFNASTDYNATDGTDTTGQGSHSRTSQTFSFVDEANKDFHLSAYDTAARDFGADLSAQGFSDDIDADTRDVNGTGWDIGADEAVTAMVYSVGTNTGNLRNTSNLTMASGEATFTASQPDYIGVGDKVTYNTSSIAYIFKRSDPTHYTLRTATGAVPDDESVAVSVDFIARAFNKLDDAIDASDGGTCADDANHLNTDDLATNNYQLDIACYGDGTADTAATITGWTTGADNYIKIYTPVLATEVGTSQRHNGKWDDTKYNMLETNAEVIINQENYVRIDGLQVKLTSSGDFNYTIYIDGTEPCDIRASNNIIVGVISNTPQDNWGLYTKWYASGSRTFKAWNNIIYGFINGASETGGIHVRTGWVTYVYNNTIYNSDYGIGSDGASSGIAKNNITQNCTNGYDGTFNASSDYNISDVSQADADSVNDVFNGYKTVSFMNEAGYDFHLSSLDTSARDAGTNLSADSNLSFSTDVDGFGRAGAWDIGADEFRGVVLKSATLRKAKVH